MNRLIFFIAAMECAVAVAAPTFAASHGHKHPRVRVKAVVAVPHRLCDWVGPGGRAVYRCTLVDPPQQRAADPPADRTPHRVCDWVGPGGRALYLCR